MSTKRVDWGKGANVIRKTIKENFLSPRLCATSEFDWLIEKLLCCKGLNENFSRDYWGRKCLFSPSSLRLLASKVLTRFQLSSELSCPAFDKYALRGRWWWQKRPTNCWFGMFASLILLISFFPENTKQNAPRRRRKFCGPEKGKFLCSPTFVVFSARAETSWNAQKSCDVHDINSKCCLAGLMEGKSFVLTCHDELDIV